MPADPHIERLLASQSTLRAVEYDALPGVIEAFDTDIEHDAVTHAYAALYTAVGDCVATADAEDRWRLPGGDVRGGDDVWYDALGRLLERQCGAEIVDLFPLPCSNQPKRATCASSRSRSRASSKRRPSPIGSAPFSRRRAPSRRIWSVIRQPATRDFSPSPTPSASPPVSARPEGGSSRSRTSSGGGSAIIARTPGTSSAKSVRKAAS